MAAYEQLWLVEPIPLARVSRGGAHVAEHQHLAKKILGQCRGVKVKSRNRVSAKIQVVRLFLLFSWGPASSGKWLKIRLLKA